MANTVIGTMQVNIGADIQSLNVAFTSIQQQFLAVQRTATESIHKLSGDMEKLGKGVQHKLILAGSLQPLIKALAGLGSKIKETINATAEWTGEVSGLARTIGTTTQEASGLTMALKGLGVSTDSYKGAVFNLQRSLDAQEDSFNKNGIATRDASGEMLNMQQIMMNTINRLREMKPGYDANALSMMAFGRSAKELQGLMRLTNESIAEGAEEAERLGMVVDRQGAAAVQRYKDAIREAGNAIESLKIAIGNKLLPTITSLANKFASVASSLAGPIVKALEVLAAVVGSAAVKAALLAIALIALRGPAVIAKEAMVKFAVSLRGVGVAIGQVITRLRGLQGSMSNLAKSIHGMLSPWNIAVITIVGAGYAINRWTTAALRAAEKSLEAARSAGVLQDKFNSLAESLKDVDSELRELEEGTAEYENAANRKALIISQMCAIYPNFNQFLRDEAGNVREIAEALRLANAARIVEIQAKIAEAEAEIKKNEAARESHATKARYLLIAQKATLGTIGMGAALALTSKRFDDSTKAIEKTNEAIAEYRAILEGLLGVEAAMGKATIVKPKGGGEDDKKKSQSRIQQWAFEQRQMAETEAASYQEKGILYRQDYETQLAFWQKKKEGENLTAEESIAIEERMLSIRSSMRQEFFNDKMAIYKDEEDALRGNLEAQIEIRKKAQSHYIQGSREWLSAQRQIDALAQQIREEAEAQKQRMSAETHAHELDMAMLDIDAEKAKADHSVAMGQMTAQRRLEVEKELVQQKYELEAEYLNWQLQNAEGNEEEQQKINNRLLVLQKQHLQNMQNLNNEMILEQRAQWDFLARAIQGSFQEGFAGLINGTMSWGDATKSVLNSVLQSFIQKTAEEFARHMTIENLKTLFTSKARAARTAIEVAGAQTSAAAEIAGAQKGMLAKAWEASAGAYKATVMKPIVGPFLAPAAAATALGAVMSMIGNLKSAAGGWGQVPYDQLAMIHKDEMVLPEKYATPLRGALEGGDGIGGGDTYNISINAIDAASFEKHLKSNRGALVRQIKGAARDFAFMG